MRKVIVKAANISSGNKLDQMTTYLHIDVSQGTEASNLMIFIDQLIIQDPTLPGFAWKLQAKGKWVHPSVLIDQVPDTIHFNQQGKRTTTTLYVRNLEFTTSLQELKDELDREFQRILAENVVIQKKDGRSHCYAFVTMS
jgi:hypothetical protein